MKYNVVIRLRKSVEQEALSGVGQGEPKAPEDADGIYGLEKDAANDVFQFMNRWLFRGYSVHLESV